MKPILSSHHTSDVGILTVTSHSCNFPSPSHRVFLEKVSHILLLLPTTAFQIVTVSYTYLPYVTNFLLSRPVFSFPPQFLLYQRAGEEEYRRECMGYKWYCQDTSNSFGTESEAMLTKDIQIFLQQKTSLFRTARNWDMQPGEPHATLLKQTRGSSFIERKRKLGRAMTKEEFHLLCFVMDVRHESFPFWPPHFILNEVSGVFLGFFLQLSANLRACKHNVFSS